MNLPVTELTPDDPEHLPPARRRRARRLLTPLEADERTDFLDRLARRTSPSFDFFLFSMLAGAVIGIGILVDSPSLLVLGVLFAPLMAPIVGISLGTVTGSVRLFFRSLVGLVIGSLLVFGMGVLAGVVSRYWLPGELSQAQFFAQLSWTNFLVLAVGAVFTVAFMVHPERHPNLPSVALAYGLYIPLTVAGFGLSSGIQNGIAGHFQNYVANSFLSNLLGGILTGIPHFWPDGLIIYAVYLAWVALFGAITLAILGFRPLTLFGYTFGAAVALLGLVLLVGISGAGAVLGEQIVFPTPVPTATTTVTLPPPTPTITPTPITPTPTFTPTMTSTPTPVPTHTLTPSPTPMYALINARIGNGAIIRAEPGFKGEYVGSYLNGILMIVLPETAEVDGETWAHVIGPDGTQGWILQSLLLVATPAPNW